MNENEENPNSPSGNNGTKEIASQATETKDIWGGRFHQNRDEAGKQRPADDQSSGETVSQKAKTPEIPASEAEGPERNRYGDLYPFQQDRPDPRTQTPEEYAKESIDRFFEIAKKTNEAKRGKPLSASSVAKIRSVVHHLESRFGDAHGALAWLRDGEGQQLKKSTFINYRGALRYIATERQDAELLAEVMLLKQDKTKAKKYKDLPTKRDKNPSPQDIEAIGHWLSTKGMENVLHVQKRGLAADPAWVARAYAVLKATYLVGLRPTEWESAKIIKKPFQTADEIASSSGERSPTPPKEQLFLHIVTAKRHHDDHRTRDIPLDGIGRNDLGLIEMVIDELQEYLKGNDENDQEQNAIDQSAPTAEHTTTKFMAHCQQIISRAVKAIFPNRTKVIQLYSARHGCASRWRKEGLSAAEISYRMGNSTIALKIYGKRGDGSAVKGAAYQKAVQAIGEYEAIHRAPEGKPAPESEIRF